MHPSTSSRQARPLLRLEIDAAAVATDWRHCDRMANYLARLASFDRTDAFLYSNLLSTVLNELFEIVFWHHEVPGAVNCTLLRSGDTDRIELEIPIDEPDRSFYETAVAQAQLPDAAVNYTRSMFGDATPDRAIGLLELAADYGAGIWLESHPESAVVRLTVEVTLENGATSTAAISQ